MSKVDKFEREGVVEGSSALEQIVKKRREMRNTFSPHSSPFLSFLSVKILLRWHSLTYVGR